MHQFWCAESQVLCGLDSRCNNPPDDDADDNANAVIAANDDDSANNANAQEHQNDCQHNAQWPCPIHS